MRSEELALALILITIVLLSIINIFDKKEVAPAKPQEEVAFVIVEQDGLRCKVFIDNEPYDATPNKVSLCEKLTKF